MKKLITIGLIVLSPLTFAKDFNHELLIGTWQCQGNYVDKSLGVTGKESFTETFYRDGTIKSNNVIHEKQDGQENTITLQIKGKWLVTSDSLLENTEKVIAYHASNQLLEKKNQYEKNLRNNDDFYAFKLIELNKNNYAFTEIEDDKLNGMTYNFACKRVK